jgi:hypothetical protein
MTEQQLAAVKQALEALEKSLPRLAPYGEQDWLDSCKAITALQSIISQDALHKMAEESRTSGLRLDDWDKIGCVNHDCDKCKAVQEPWGYLEIDDIESQREYPHNCRNVNLWHEGGEGMTAIYIAPPVAQPAPVQEPVTWGVDWGKAGDIPCVSIIQRLPDGGIHVVAVEYAPYSYTTPPAPQPVPVKTYHDGKPWPVQPNPWVGLSEKEVEAYDSWADFQVGCGRQTLFDMVRDIEAKLKEKNA